MSLEGALETVALPEVLNLLADTSKSGELSVRGERAEGRLWFESGRLTGFDVGRCHEVPDALFDLLRIDTGRFSFVAGSERPEDVTVVGGGGEGEGEEPGEDIRPSLEVAQTRLVEWADIVAVVPSLAHVISLVVELPDDNDDVHLDRAQWALVVAVGEGRAVQGILDDRSLPEFDGCRSLKRLVDSGLAKVDEPVVASEPAPEPDTDPRETEPEAYQPDPIVESPAVFEAETTDPPFERDHVYAEAVTPSESVAGHFDGSDFVFHSSDTSDGSAEYTGKAWADGEVAASNGTTHADWTFSESDTNGHSSNGHASNGHASNGYDANAADTTYAGDFEPQPVPYPEPHGDLQVSHFDPPVGDDSEYAVGPRAALDALLAEIPADDETGTGRATYEPPATEPPADGLADRGPWTSQELTQMGGWHDEESTVRSTATSTPEYDQHAYDDEAHPGETHAGETHAGDAHDDAYDDGQDDEPESDPQPEPVNRGLLLKFLSSVRS